MLVAVLVLTIINVVFLFVVMAAIGSVLQKIDQMPGRVAQLIADVLKKAVLGGRN